ncbi:MAG: 2-dehydro-3-deoxygalactonokinase [Telluria sp.]
MSEHLLGVDWGSTNRRAYLLDHAGACLRRHADDVGMLSARGRFGAALAQLCAEMAAPPGTRVVMSGMAGSAQGWHEVPYLTPDVPLDALPLHAFAVPDAGMPACIVPGYAQRARAVEVMRGEETQLLGALALGYGDGVFILPGTHSKWARVQDRRLVHWSTYMTGELFAALAQGGTLAALMAQESAPAAQSDAFAEGLAQARQRDPLTHALFTVRARAVTGSMEAGRARAFVSGLLIGAEFVDCALAPGATVHLIGSPALAERYATAARDFGLRSVTIDPDQAYCAALARFLAGEAA